MVRKRGVVCGFGLLVQSYRPELVISKLLKTSGVLTSGPSACPFWFVPNLGSLWRRQPNASLCIGGADEKCVRPYTGFSFP